jgi:hypothetical protein
MYVDKMYATLRAWSLICNKKTIGLFERHCNATEKPEAIACARRCWSSWLTSGRYKKNNRKKWRVKEEERHKGSLIQNECMQMWIFRYFKAM